ncbi:amidohydrolase family protein, partial [Bacillus sp. SIMBA_005]|uniref:amidohydrolase family protein n=1 Tax=Bacillus sp. SIMBA_005 TaxID=3085754 RepID=UPI0039794220
LELMLQAGFTPQQALTTATRDAARLLRFDDRGLLQPGKRADFVVLTADPLADIRNTRRIDAVWQAGRRVAGPVADAPVD